MSRKEVLIWGLCAIATAGLALLPRWLLKGAELPPEERRRYRALIRLAVRDALTGQMGRKHPEILTRSGEAPGLAKSG